MRGNLPPLPALRQSRCPAVGLRPFARADAVQFEAFFLNAAMGCTVPCGAEEYLPRLGFGFRLRQLLLQLDNIGLGEYRMPPVPSLTFLGRIGLRLM